MAQYLDWALPFFVGMPYPQNFETAKEVERIVRENGAVPATIAILDGTPCIGIYSYLSQLYCALSYYFIFCNSLASPGDPSGMTSMIEIWQLTTCG